MTPRPKVKHAPRPVEAFTAPPTPKLEPRQRMNLGLAVRDAQRWIRARDPQSLTAQLIAARLAPAIEAFWPADAGNEHSCEGEL